MTDDELIADFEAARLDLASFHHAEHIRMGFLYLSRLPVLESLQRFSAALVRLAAAAGKPDLYHETITWAFLLLIRERMARAGAPQSWLEFAAANQDLMSWEHHVLAKYYREETLRSPLARAIFLLPDRLATP